MTDRTFAFEVAAIDYTTETFETELEDGAVVRQDEAVLHATGYDADGSWRHAKIRGFEPYFYVDRAEAEAADFSGMPEVSRISLYDSSNAQFESVRGRKVARVYTRLPKHVRDVRERFDDHWESDVLFSTRFLIDLGITSGICVPDDREYVDAENVEACEVHADWRVHVMDIEVDDRNGFPRDGEQPILCITAYDSFVEEYVVWITGSPDHDPSAPEAERSDRLHDDPVHVRWFGTEESMIRSYLAYLDGSNPSVVTGWNVDDFDASYLVDRCAELGIETDALSPIWDVRDGYYGPDVGGLVVLDLLRTYKARQFTEKDSYRLDAVAADEIGTAKAEYVGTIGDLWEDDPAALIDYNLRDVELCVELDRRQDLIAFAKEIKRFVGCELSDAIVESVAADRYLLALCHGDVVLPPQHSREGEDYEGAAVFDAAHGLHEWVATLDLASLYPMSMLTLNASPETKVDPDAYDGDTVHSPNGVHFRTDQPGITRDAITTLLEKRVEKKNARDRHDPDSDEYDVYDRQQAAVKVIMNSLYGVMAWTKFRLYDVDVASAVTATGRAVIEETGRQVEAADREVLYGDSVPGYEPVHVRPRGARVGVPQVVRIDEAWERVGRGTDLDVWNDGGWTPIENAIRKPNRKQMYRVTTGAGVVHVTEDHGLLRADGTEVPPTDVDEGDRLFHAEPAYDEFEETGLPDRDEYEPTDRETWLYGVFVGDGSAGTYDSEYGRKSQWKVSKDDAELLHDVADAMEAVHDVNCEVAYVDDEDRTGVVRPNGNDPGTIPSLAAAFRAPCYDADGAKRVPLSVLNGDREMVLSFLDGYRRADGEDSDRDDALFKRAYSASHTFVAGMTTLAARLGMSVGIETRDNHGTEYLRFWFRNWTRSDTARVQSVEPVDYSGEYVYDLSTATEHFNAGVGTITVHNTDSVLLDLNDASGKAAALAAGHDLEDAINASYDAFAADALDADDHWFELEFETLYRRYFQSGKKKRYAGHVVWKEGKDVDEVSITGYEYKRSSTAGFAKDVQYGVIRRIVAGHHPDAVLAYVRDQRDRLECRDVALDDIGIPGGIGKDLHDYARDSDAQYAPRAAKYGNLVAGMTFGRDSKPKRYYLDGANPALFDRLEADGWDASRHPLYREFRHDPFLIGVERPEQLPRGVRIDWDETHRKLLKAPLEDILAALDIPWVDIETDTSQAGLGEFTA